MIWRISKYTDLIGRGGLAVSGRWHTSPRPIVYASAEAYTAYCERIRHLGHASLLPDGDKLMKIDCPSSVEIEDVDVSHLDPAWSSNSVGWRICRPIGDEWLRSGRTALLKVPSAARNGAFNYLINPAAFRANEISVLEALDQPFPDFATQPMV
ncbi:RES family NAD+ phosphorylase [Beijerinckia sp. L45]|uniref:RES family NAD+ phosphorylase n=1 Tax=Beijerinckia sp. L45 TaxID=1641855 RepID=UPI00131D6624|nr:RES family NAD+ phosphorylase [Beijerinckia sp. L45]